MARPTKSLVLYLQQVGRCMRHAKNKEYGIVLDNAGLWLEHGISYIDRDWSLQGAAKHNLNVSTEKIIGTDEDGRLREITRPAEADGLELLEVKDDLERLLVFESYIRNAKTQQHKLVSVAYRYKDYLLSQKKSFTDFEIKYCHNRLNNEGCNYNIGFWYHRKKELDEQLKLEN